VVALLLRAEASEWTFTGDVDAVWRGAEAEDLGVEPDGDVDVVVSGKEEDRVAFGAELVAALRGVDLVDLRLDRRPGHGRVEDEDVGAEVRGGGGGRNRRTGHGREQGERKSELRRHSYSGLPRVFSLYAFWRMKKACFFTP
jgi:hypothetical protein